MKRLILYSIILVVFALGIAYLLLPREEYASDQETLAQGQDLFKKHCMTCHGLKDDGIGPPLGGITKLQSRNTLVSFIINPSKAIEAGEDRAVSQYERYKLLMPTFAWMGESQIKAILAYVHQQTNLYDIEPVSISKLDNTHGLTGRLVAPIQKSNISIELEEVIQLPQLGTSTDLGVVTLRAHPSADGTLFASDQNGIIYRINNGKAGIFLNIREHIKDFQSGPGIATGIGSFDFHPDYLNNGLIYISHAETYKGQKADYTFSDTIKAEVQWVIGEWKMENVKNTQFEGTYRELLRLHAPTFGHGCQDVAFLPGLSKGDSEYGLLYFGFGDGGSNNIKHPELGHHLKSFLGSIMRIDPAGNNSLNGKYGIPPANPLVNESDPQTVKEIYAFGFRNPHRMTWDKANGNRMIATDIGESNIEELNIIENGGDYGWPVREGNFGIATVKDLKTVFNISEIDRALYKQPFAQYDHEEGNAISGGYVYEGNLTALKNKYIFGDIVNGRLFYVNMDSRLSDSTIYELTIVKEGKETSMKELSQTKRLHLRIGYDQYRKELYIISKSDGRIRRVINAQ
jgi:glucose/arabinose dehydrogenase/mono/diheme cytochrome c family protein